MSIFRSYISKNNTLIKDNLSNSSQNPVTEISYGTFNKQPSRFIFDVDLSTLMNRIESGLINPNRIVKHVLHMTNTIRYAEEYTGRKSYSLGIQRASSFDLDFYNISEDWDEGSGYDLEFNDELNPNIVDQASNWYERKTDVLWSSEGAYNSGTTEIIGTQRFETGAENIELDVTDYINARLFSRYTGQTGGTGNTYGIGVKFPDNLEEIEDELRYAVAFHAKNTNTWYEPYIETIIDDGIIDDRNYFYLNKDNDLYLYVNIGGFKQNIDVNYVNIYDYEDQLVQTFTGDSIINVIKGIYKISLNVDSSAYPDAVLFRDEWGVTINNRNSEFENDFYLISEDKFYDLDNSNQINFDNYYFNFYGINEQQNITAGDIRKIKLTIKELYQNQNNFIPLELEYRVFINVGEKYEIDVIPFTSVDRTNRGYEFNLDTSWLIPQDYKLQLRMRNGDIYQNKQTLSFTIVSNKLI